MKYEIRKKQSKTYEKERNGQDISSLILHYTAGSFRASLNILAGSIEASAHYLVPDPGEESYTEDDLVIFQLVDEKDTAWHAGRSAWKEKSGLNRHSIGVEIVNLAAYRNGAFTFPEYNDEQVTAVIELCRDVLKRNPSITPTHVLGHSDISPGRKHDPGPKFPWKKLYENGIGAWYDEETKKKYEEQYSKRGIPSGVEFVQKQLKEYGYKIDVTYTMDEQTKSVVKAFQMHFRPDNVNSSVDYETAAILSALVEKYKTKST